MMISDHNIPVFGRFAVLVGDMRGGPEFLLAARFYHRRRLKLDVAEESAWKWVMATTLEQFGRLDVLVNNAGVG